jgi:Zn-dependent protease
MQACPSCGTTAPVHFVVCPKCHRLFHADELVRLDALAGELEKEGNLVGSVQRLREMTPLLPAKSRQATELTARIASLESKIPAAQRERSNAPKWVVGLGAVGLAVWKFGAPVLLILSKAKFLLAGLVKLPTLLTMMISASLWSENGLGMGVLMIASIYVHEIGHVVAFQRYGIAVTAPMFVPGVGAFVRGSHYPQAPSAAADVALSGPIWGGLSGVLIVIAAAVFDLGWLSLAGIFVAELNLFNLLPVWQLDGNRATGTLSRRQVAWLGGIGLPLSLLAGSPMGMLATGGLLVRTFVAPPPGPGDARSFRTFMLLILGLLALRVVAPLGHRLVP